MYYFAIGIGDIGLIWNLNLERLNVVILMIKVVLSGDLRLDDLGGLLDNSFMDNG